MPAEKTVKRIVIAGPTGIGKTSTSLSLVRKLRCLGNDAAIISADSRQCYKLLNIGTGKITEVEMGNIPHLNISILNPDETDTAAAFVRRAEKWESEILQNNQVPLYVGGSTLHLQSLIWPLDDIPGACVYNQIKLAEQEKELGHDFILDLLKEADPVYATQMDGYNRHRIFRALDVYMQTGNPFSSYHSDQNLAVVPDDTLLIVLTMNRIHHVELIESRIDKMIQDGLINETQQLLKHGYNPTLQALQTVGYKEVIEHINGSVTHEEMIQKIKISTRQYAKRQATWFRRWKSATFLDITDQTPDEIAEKILMEFNCVL